MIGERGTAMRGGRGTAMRGAQIRGTGAPMRGERGTGPPMRRGTGAPMRRGTAASRGIPRNETFDHGSSMQGNYIPSDNMRVRGRGNRGQRGGNQHYW